MIASVGSTRTALETVVTCHVAVRLEVKRVSVPAVTEHCIGSSDHLVWILHGELLIDNTLWLYLDEAVA